MCAICVLKKYSENKVVRAGPAQPDAMQQIHFSKTDDMRDIFFKTDEMVAICLLQKSSANKIVRAGPAQPAQPDERHQICFSQTNEMLDICLYHTKNRKF